MVAALCISFVVQFVFFGVILFFKKTGNTLSNKIFGASVFLLGLASIQFVYLYSGDFDSYLIWLIDLPWFFSFCYVPLVYFNAKAISKEPIPLDYRFLLHFLPALFALIYFSQYYGLNRAEKFQYLYHLRHYPEDLSIGTQAFGILFYISFIGYTLVSIRKFRQQEEDMQQVYSNVEQYTLSWYSKAYGFLLVLSLLAGVLSTLNAPYYLYLPILFGLIILQYLIVYCIFNQPDLSATGFSEYQKAKDQIPGVLFQNEDEITQLNNQLEHLMRDKELFKQPNLTLPVFAQAMDMSIHQASAYINQIKKVNFNELINTYRVEYACNLLKSNTNKKYSTEQMAEMAGFNSKSSFYKVFKKHIGLTPQAYLKDKSSLSL